MDIDNDDRINVPIRDDSVVAVALRYGIEPAELEQYCQSNYVRSSVYNGVRYIFESGEKKLAEIAARPELENLLLVVDDSLILDYHPELTDYMCFHGALDIWVWLVKLRYSTKDVIKSRKYTLHGLLNEFLTEQKFDMKRLSRLVGQANSKEKFMFHLSKGWYNELARSAPLEPEMLAIGTQTSPDYSKGKPVAWHITQSYYAVYEFVNALVFTNSDNLRTDEHRKSTRHFNGALLPKFSGRLIPYPFNLTNPIAGDINAIRGQSKSFWNYQYATYPRDQGNMRRTVYDLERDFIKLLTGYGNPLELLYKIRVWANYLGIDTIIELQNGYYLSFLYKNLGVLCFFYACFAEVMSLAYLGEDETLGLLENILFKYALQQDNFKDRAVLLPMLLRFRLYHHHGLISKDVKYLIPKSSDPMRDIL